MGRFAGSNAADARRRRRLATEDVSNDNENENARAPDDPSGHDVGAPSSNFPLERLIRRSPWMTALVVLIVSSVAVGLVLVNRAPIVAQKTWGEPVAELLRFPGGRFVALFQAVLIFAAAVLCFIIGWARSRSQSDYSGEYRVWKWAWKFWTLIGIGVATNAQVAFADVFGRLARPTWNHPELLNWILPLALVGLPIQMRCLRDMSRSWLNSGLLAIGLIVWMCVVSGPLFPNLAIRSEFVPMVHLAVCCVVFCAMLLHARFVLHVSCDPPESPLRNSGMHAADTGPGAPQEYDDEFAALDAGIEQDLPEFAEPAESSVMERETDAEYEPVDTDDEFAVLNQPIEPLDEAEDDAATETVDLSAQATSETVVDSRVFRMETAEELEETPPAVSRRRKRKSGRR